MRTTVPAGRPEPLESEIQKAAYLLWQELGRPASRDVEIWLAAKEMLRHRPESHTRPHASEPPSGMRRVR